MKGERLKKLIIVGYDPGTTSALAIVDTNRRLLLLKSKRNMKRKEVVDTVTSRGKPILVAGDKHPLPKSVEKLASSLGCKAYSPSESLSTLEKWRLVNEFLEKIKNDHEKDALASALKAYEKYSKLFKKTDRVLSYLGLSGSFDKVIEMIVSGKAENITEAVNRVLTEMREKKEKMMKVEEKLPKAEVQKIRELRMRLRQKEKDILILKEYNEGLKKKLEEMKKDLEKVKKSKGFTRMKELEAMRKKVKLLQRRLKEKDELLRMLNLLRKLELRGKIPLIELKDTSPEGLERVDKAIGLEKRVLLVRNFRNIHALNEYRVRAVISHTKPEEAVLERVNFPLITLDNVSVEEIEGIKVMDMKEFEKRVKDARKVGFVQWLKSHRRRKL